MENTTTKAAEELTLLAYIGLKEVPEIFSNLDFDIRQLQNEFTNAVYDNLPHDVYAHLQEEEGEFSEETKQKGDKILSEMAETVNKIDSDLNKMASDFMENLKSYLASVVIPRV